MDWKEVGKQVLSKGAPLLGGMPASIELPVEQNLVEIAVVFVLQLQAE